MSYIYHCYLGQIPPESNASLQDLREEIARQYAGQPREHALMLQDHHLIFRIEDYTFDIRYVTGDHVAVESVNMARYYVGDDPAAKSAIQSSLARFEMSGDDDPEFQYVHDAVVIQAAMQALGVTWIFDPFRGKFVQR